MLRNLRLLTLSSAVLTGLLFVLPAWGAVDISDFPLDTQVKAAPANIMFVLDDSGSMDWEFMTSESDGLFSGERYVFDNPGDNLYSSSYILSDTQRLMWKSQWAGYNKMYYNPSSTYEPWPTLNNADPDNPRSHPNIAGNTLNLSSTYLQMSSAPALIVDNKDSGFSTVSGSWHESGASPEYNNSSYYSSSSGATARWTLNVGTAGDYQVWMWWTSKSGWSRDTNARYRINHAGGSTDYYRNLTIDYGKWNLLGNHTFNAGTTTVELLRGNSTTAADAVKLVDVSSTVVDIPRAHYYVYSDVEAKPYLVTIDGTNLQYYAVTTSGTGGTETVESLTLDTTPPADVKSTRAYTEERQNFANWYSFYRRRELTATAAVSNVISKMEGVQIGISSINDRINQVVKKIKVNDVNGIYVDETTALLTSLYSLVLQADGTPLRRGLEDVGQYYHQNDSNSGGIGSSPYWTAADGGECQQSFAVLMTDGYWNGSDPSSAIGNADGNNGVPYADNYSITLADVATYYWENDLSSGLSNLVPTSILDSSSEQHMVTYGISFGVTGTLNPDDYNLTSGPYPTWPSPWSGSKQKIDDLYHASVNGRGIFLNAANPGELVSTLLDVMQNIKQRIGSASSVTVNGDQLFKQVDDNTYMYQSSYSSNGWSGDVKAYRVDLKTGALDSKPAWTVFDAWQGLDWTTRKIVTYNGTTGIPFQFADLTSAQQALLDADPAVATKVLNYVRGDRSHEVDNGGTFRTRSRLLGDIVHSSPIYHDGLLYTGANDGMLHVLVAEGVNAGKERFAYVPSQVIQNLSLLAIPNYSHRYYVDLTVKITKSVKVGSVNKTILVGGLGQGGLGYYALDLTNLTSAETELNLADRVMWEFPNASTAAADLADIGYSFSEVVIVKTNDEYNPWVVIFGNGYNSSNGRSVLFALDPATGAVLKKFELGIGPNNGLATPAVVDVNGDHKADYVYGGDLNGNLWKVDLTGPLSQWDVAYKDGATAKPLFRAVGAGGSVQPITSQPDVMSHPDQHGSLVVFGTGKFIGISDFTNKSEQTLYGIWDYGDDEDDSEYLGVFDHDNNQLSNQPYTVSLLEQTVVATMDAADPDNPGKDFLRVLSNNKITWRTQEDPDSPLPNLSSSDANHAGWYFDLPNLGERSVTKIIIREGIAIVITFVPTESPCSSGGFSIVHGVDADSGGRVEKLVFDINDDGVIDNNDRIEITDPTTGKKIDVTPTGIGSKGRLQAPAIVIIGNKEYLYLGGDEDEDEEKDDPPLRILGKKSVRLGVSYWQEL